VNELREEARIQWKADRTLGPPDALMSGLAKCRDPMWDYGVVPIRYYQNSCHFRVCHKLDPSKTRASLGRCGQDGCMGEIDKGGVSLSKPHHVTATEPQSDFKQA
jgi:hypothetical protein